MEVNRVSEVVTSLADQAANVIFGAVVDNAHEGEVGACSIITTLPKLIIDFATLFHELFP